jgi:hypothetical protein
VVAEGVRYRGNPNDFVELSFTIASLSGHIAWLPLFHGTWQAADVTAIQPVFQIIAISRHARGWEARKRRFK